MAQNIDWLGAVYPSVPAIQLPKQGGGQALFADPTPTTASAPDVASGKQFLTASGTVETGTASGGGGVTVEALSVSANGTYTAPTGKAYSPVTVCVGGSDDTWQKIVTKTISGTISDPNISFICSSAFYACISLTGADFPKVTVLSSGAFWGCVKLSSINFPVLSSIGSYGFCSGLSSMTSVSFPALKIAGQAAFQSCKTLVSISCSAVTSISSTAFGYCSSVTSLSFPMASTISTSAFWHCSKLESSYFLGTSVPKLSGNPFTYTPMSNSTYIGKFGSIYVRSSMLAAFKSSTNWTTYSARMVGLTDEQIAAL